MKVDKTYFILLVPLVILIGYWQERPFQTHLGEAHSNIGHLNRNAKKNIGLACKKIDNYVIRPGETFSFNHVVGPRTYDFGFVSAPTYMGNETRNTEGGGVCLVSSLLYQAALESGLSVERRTPHKRTISTVLPGLDATVWFPNYDLKLRNNSAEPMKIHCEADFRNVAIEILGPPDADKYRIVRRIKPASADQVAVTVYLQHGEELKEISNDLYDKTVRR